MGRTKRKKRNQKYTVFVLLLALAIIAALICGWSASHKVIYPFGFAKDKESIVEHLKITKAPDFVDEQLIHIHSTARTGAKLEDVKNIVIHYVGNPGTSAQNNRNYFDKDSTGVSSHFIVGLEGEIIQCIPLYERSAASNHRNKDTISIEVCHPDESGKFNEITYASLLKLTGWLIRETGLQSHDVIRHFDITGKECPLYYVKHEDAWKTFIKDVEETANEWDQTQNGNE